MEVIYRQVDYDDADYGPIVAIARAIDPDHVETARELEEYDTVAREAGRISTRWLATVDDEVVGVAHISVAPYQPDNRIFHDVAVLPLWQGLGIGAGLLERAEAVGRQAGRQVVTTTTSDRHPRALRMLERAGYRQADSRSESVLDLQAWDPAAFSDAIDLLTTIGVRIRSVAELAAAAQENWLQDLHDLYVTVEQDVPQPMAIELTPLREFEALAIDSKAALPEAFLVAEADGDFIGLTEPALVLDRPGALAQRLTGVRADHRHRGIATGLKVHALNWAKERGFIEIRTQNGVGNETMLAINRRLGFEQQATDYLYVKEL